MNATDVLQDIGVCSSALVQKLTHRFANSAREELESFNTEVAMTASAIEAAILREDGLNETVFLGLEKDTRLIAERWQELKRAHANLDAAPEVESPDEDSPPPSHRSDASPKRRRGN